MSTVSGERHAGGRPRTWEPCELGKRIERIAARRRMSLEALAAASGVGLNTLYRVIGGQTPDPRVSTIVALANALNVPVDKLVTQTAATSRATSRSARRPA